MYLVLGEFISAFNCRRLLREGLFITVEKVVSIWQCGCAIMKGTPNYIRGGRPRISYGIARAYANNGLLRSPYNNTGP